MNINNISRPQALQVGAAIKVINGPFHAKIYRSTFTMDLYLQNTFIRSFPVGLGKPGMETPTGLWRVKADGKLIEPPWPDPVSGKILQPGDPDYALGSRWIGLEGLDGDAKGRTGFGIHGTKESETIGTSDSRGCIRLHNGNVIFVYDLLVPIHSLIRIEE
jgi:lipoprotein-anchoring transpeptidase ErfK/SrfK